MAHFRKRHINEPFKKLIQHARILGVVGHRQTGKSTFVEAVAEDYCTLDDADVLHEARVNAKNFVNSLAGNRSAIDECQLAPELFPALKAKIGTSNKPGRFILSGSVRFSSRNAIRESLTGRIINQEMLPLVLTELHELPNSSAVLRLFEDRPLRTLVTQYNIMTSLKKERVQQMQTYLHRGGLPGLCFVRADSTRQTLLRDLVETILDRDVRLVYPTSLPFEQIRALCSYIAQRPLEPINLQEIRRETSLSPVTTNKLLRALEGVFLLRRIPFLGDAHKKEAFLFEDQLEAHAFTGSHEAHEQEWLGLFYRNARAQFSYRFGGSARYSSYATRGGAQVPFVIEYESRKIGFFVFSSADDIDRKAIASSESFLKNYDKGRVIFAVINSHSPELLSERMAQLPLSSLVF